jgi:hypothetical protein
MSTLEQTLNQARQRVLAGENLTVAEQAELVKLLRQNRFGAAEAGATARTRKTATKAAAKGVSDEDLDAQLEGLGL